MKELSIAEKAKAYDEALEKVRQLYAYPTTKPFISDLQDLFPELKESEDEKIRKELIRAFTVTADKRDYEIYGNGITYKQVLAWLEKQGEQKPVDRIEPKFHKGDWIIHQGTGNIYQVVARIDNQYQLKYGDNYTVQKCVDVDRCARLWNITKDAKDGDVLVASDGSIFLFAGVDDCACKYYTALTTNNDVKINKEGSGYWETSRAVHPATKEQRDALTKAMTDAGYTFDFEKKELKKIEQKPAENKELTEFDKAVGVSIGTWNPKTPEQIQSVKAVSKKLLKLAKKQINDEQKSAEWSEEDEDNFNSAIYYIRREPYMEKTIEPIVDWLKSPKDRVGNFDNGYKVGFSATKCNQ